MSEVGESSPVEETATTVSDPCDGVPVLTWDTFGEGFFIGHCNGCHSAEGDLRHDAPEEIRFDTPAQAWALKEAILFVASGDEPSMPPNGGVPEDDRTKLGWWLTCGAEGT